MQLGQAHLRAGRLAAQPLPSSVQWGRGVRSSSGTCRRHPAQGEGEGEGEGGGRGQARGPPRPCSAARREAATCRLLIGATSTQWWSSRTALQGSSRAWTATLAVTWWSHVEWRGR